MAHRFTGQRVGCWVPYGNLVILKEVVRNMLSQCHNIEPCLKTMCSLSSTHGNSFLLDTAAENGRALVVGAVPRYQCCVEDDIFCEVAYRYRDNFPSTMN